MDKEKNINIDDHELDKDILRLNLPEYDIIPATDWKIPYNEKDLEESDRWIDEQMKKKGIW